MENALSTGRRALRLTADIAAAIATAGLTGVATGGNGWAMAGAAALSVLYGLFCFFDGLNSSTI